jgi:hypothetical protein
MPSNYLQEPFRLCILDTCRAHLPSKLHLCGGSLPSSNYPRETPQQCLRENELPDATRRQHVEVSRIIAEIDAQISKLQQARELLAGTTAKAGKGPGRPKGSKNAKSGAGATATPRKRKLSPEGRKRIADAMKRRWAERRKQAAKSTPATK